MHTSTKKWLFTKISSLILIPLMTWFLINFVSIYDKNHSQIIIFFSEQPSKILFSVKLKKEYIRIRIIDINRKIL